MHHQQIHRRQPCLDSQHGRLARAEGFLEGVYYKEAESRAPGAPASVSFSILIVTDCADLQVPPMPARSPVPTASHMTPTQSYGFSQHMPAGVDKLKPNAEPLRLAFGHFGRIVPPCSFP